MTENLQNEEKNIVSEIVQNEEPKINKQNDNPIYTAGLIIGILSIVFGLLFALIGDILGIIGIVLNVNKRKENNTTAGLILSIIGLVVAIINNILGAILAIVLYNNL